MQTANLIGALVGTLLALGLVIAGFVMTGLLIDGSAQDLLVQLNAEKIETTNKINALKPQLPFLVNCTTQLITETNDLANCTMQAETQCAQNSEDIDQDQQMLNALNTEGLNMTLQNSLNASCVLIFTFEDEIAFVANNLTTAIPHLISSGTFLAHIPGTIEQNVSGVYELQEVYLSQLRLRYVLLKRWPNSVQVNMGVMNGEIVYDQFDPPLLRDYAAASASCEFSRPILQGQVDRFVFSTSGSKIHSYSWQCSVVEKLVFIWQGTTVMNELISQNQDLTVLGSII